MRGIVDKGYAPTVEEIAAQFKCPIDEAESALKALAEYHGVVLHPNQPKVWVIHPFALAPTHFFIQAASTESTPSQGCSSWWGNCAWCSLGAAALLRRDLTITTTLGAEKEQVILRVTSDGQLLDSDYVVHFPVPMKNAWDNVMYTCNVMLLFRNHEEVDDWSKRHGIPKGDVQPVANIWAMAKVWYGKHLDADWKKWTLEEAKEIFERFGLTHAVWKFPSSGERF